MKDNQMQNKLMSAKATEKEKNAIISPSKKKEKVVPQKLDTKLKQLSRQKSASPGGSPKSAMIK